MPVDNLWLLSSLFRFLIQEDQAARKIQGVKKIRDAKSVANEKRKQRDSVTEVIVGLYT